jgi:hypothetical protein
MIIFKKNDENIYLLDHMRNISGKQYLEIDGNIYLPKYYRKARKIYYKIKYKYLKENINT